MLHRWRAVGNTVSDLTGPRFETQTSRSRDECVTARPTDMTNFTMHRKWSQAIKSFRNNSDITITNAYKSIKAFILHKSYYLTKMNVILV